MAFALLIIGITLVTVAVRNMQAPFISLLGGDFTGPGNFVYWVIAILVIGAVGYIPKAKGISDGLLVLILIALILSRGNPNLPGGGVFQQLMNALQTTKAPSSNAIQNATNLVGQTINNLTSVSV